MITRVEATNYRCFGRLDVELAAFNVLVGANGSGKTTLLDIPVLLGDLMRTRTVGGAFVERRDGRAPRAGSLDELVHQGRGDWFVLAVEAAMPATIALSASVPIMASRSSKGTPAIAAVEAAYWRPCWRSSMSMSVAWNVFCALSATVARSEYSMLNAFIVIMAMFAASSKSTALAFMSCTMVGMAVPISS